MELASRGKWRIREATQEDTGSIGRLLGTASQRHLHADWHLPVDWLGTPGFVLCEKERALGRTDLVACLAVGADPPPAAWVRVAAVNGGSDAQDVLGHMLRSTLPWLQENGVVTLGWLPEQFWPEQWLTGLGFRQVNRIVTYGLTLEEEGVPDGQPARYGLAAEPGSDRPVIRPVSATADLPRLAEIEAQAFEPLWRTSQNGLMQATRQALSFDVAEFDGRIVGFQYSVAGQDDQSAHLVRLTVDPQAQGRGIGSSLLLAALGGYARLGARRITLNTQLDNEASHRLYRRFGFRPLSGQAVVWALEIC